ncbi:MAG: DIP1984 family protein [Phycisphaeraceae bacterium]|nr:DIP1984 family protein [Phycisphaeraceae bacterium]
MKLAEALILRGSMQKKLASLRERIAVNILVQEGSQPHEDPLKLLAEAAGVLDEFEKLVTAINAANLAHRLPDGRTLTAAIAHRDALSQRISMLDAALHAARKDPDRYSAREIKWVASIDVSKLQKQSEDFSAQLRE